MRHKYETRGIVLSRVSLGEAHSLITLLTPQLGLVRARAQGIRKPGAKLSAALVTLAESDVVLVRGKEGWRISGAVLAENWFMRLSSTGSRVRAARGIGLCVQLVVGEMREPNLFRVVKEFLQALADFPEPAHESIEICTALHIVSILGLDAGTNRDEDMTISLPRLAHIRENRKKYIVRINNGIAASGL